MLAQDLADLAYCLQSLGDEGDAAAAQEAARTGKEALQRATAAGDEELIARLRESWAGAAAGD